MLYQNPPNQRKKTRKDRFSFFLFLFNCKAVGRKEGVTEEERNWGRELMGGRGGNPTIRATPPSAQGKGGQREGERIGKGGLPMAQGLHRLLVSR